jgi:hypothetical protein
VNAIDVIGSKIALGKLLAMAEPGEAIAAAELSRLTRAKGDDRELEQVWLETLVETARLGGVGSLERGRSGVVFRFAEDPPGLDDAIGRALDAVA